MEKVVYCITNEKGLYYNKAEGYRYSNPPYCSTFNTLFTLYRNTGNAQNIADALNEREGSIIWKVKPMLVTPFEE